jgi:hypothetical protein
VRAARRSIEVSQDDDDSALLHVKASDDEWHAENYSFKGRSIARGAIIEVGWRNGALGFTWESHEPTLVMPR